MLRNSVVFLYFLHIQLNTYDLKSYNHQCCIHVRLQQYLDDDGKINDDHQSSHKYCTNM